MQLGWIKKDPFMQLPNMTPEACQILREALPPGTTIYKYAIMDELQRKALLSNIFEWTPEQYEDHMIAINALPLIKVKMTAEVQGEEQAQVGDILTCKLRVDFLKLQKGEQSGYVHSNTYPYLRREGWYLIITEETMTGLAVVEKLPVEENFYEKEF